MCNIDCDNCPDQHTCDSCRDTLCISINQCIPCPIKTFPSQSAGLCQGNYCYYYSIFIDKNSLDCPANCITCQDENICLFCDAGFYLFPDGICRSTCDLPFTFTSGKFPACNPPCSDHTHFYDLDDQICKATCHPPDISQQIFSFYQTCQRGAPNPNPNPNPIPNPNQNQTTEILDAVQTSTNGATHVSNAISPGSIRGISAGIAGKIFTNIKYLNITYSAELENAVQTWKSDILPFELGIKIPEKIENGIDEQDIPYDFLKRETPANFLLNYWDDLIYFGIVFGVYFLTFLFHKVALKTQTKYFPCSVTEKLNIALQNYLLTQLFTAFGDIVFFSVLDLRSIRFSSTLSILGFIIMIVLIIAMLAGFTAYFWVLLKYQKIKEQEGVFEKFLKKHEGHQLFYNDFKDANLFQQSVLFIMVAKDIAFSLIITTLFEYPVLQVILSLVLSALMIAYYLIKKPFKSTFEAIQQIIYEVIILIVIINVTILALLDDNNSLAYKTRNNIGKAIIVLNFCFNFLAFLFLLAKIGETLWEAYTHYKNKRKTHSEANKSKTQADSTVSNLMEEKNNNSFLDSSRLRVRRGPNFKLPLQQKDISSSILKDPQSTRRARKTLENNSIIEDLDRSEASGIISDPQSKNSSPEIKLLSFVNEPKKSVTFQIEPNNLKNSQTRTLSSTFDTTEKEGVLPLPSHIMSRKLTSYLHPEEMEKMNFSVRNKIWSFQTEDYFKNKFKASSTENEANVVPKTNMNIQE